ncbi:MAG: crosslink repair DNA glycosylase YcaQ family protein, partial [Casimicrobiaceae bacterium]
VGRLIAHLVELYAPIPETTLRQLTMMLRYGAPHLESRLRERTVLRKLVMDDRLRAIEVDGMNWFVPAGERIAREAPNRVRLLAPFDPVVWDRRRFELFWGWRYRFEAYTPPARRLLGYYALPLLWRDRVIGWSNIKNDESGRMMIETGFVGSRPRDPAFKLEFDAETERMREFLGAKRIVKSAPSRG